MKSLLTLTMLAAGFMTSALADDAAMKNWPAWRGPLLTGVGPLANPPVTWSETNNIKWKVEVPGSANSSPIVWNDQVFVITAVPTGNKTIAKEPAAPPGARQVMEAIEEHRFMVIAYDRANGKVRWEQTPRTEIPHEGHHKDHGYASYSPFTDGEVLLAYFGSRGLHAYDLNGKLLWQKDFGKQTTRNGFGEGSSPALYKDTVVVVWDHEGEDFITALDRKTGKELWRKAREEATNWSTPLVVVSDGKPQVVVNSSKKVKCYDMATGEVMWEAGGQTANAIPTPVAGHGRVYVTSGFRGASFQAITLGKTGDLTGTDAIAWSLNKNTPYVPSPLLYGDLLYFMAGNNGQLTIADAKDGKVSLDAERLDGIFGVYASPTGAADRVYLTGRNGVVWVLKKGPTLEVLAKNKLDDGFDSTPALAGNELFLRGHKSLYALAEAGGK